MFAKVKFVMTAALLTTATYSYGQTAGRSAVRVFGDAHITAVYRVSLDRDALVLESIMDVIEG